jgi:hypothetical protein
MDHLTYDERSFLMYHINKLYRKKFNIIPQLMYTSFGLIVSIQRPNVNISIIISKKNDLFLITYKKSFGIGENEFLEELYFDDIEDVYFYIKDVINMITPPMIYH